ncbi:MAG TPA: nucleoside hydrolase [Planctomycetaceae bacterium]|nr:nucleoside hydrolase [Planctomycetaceae bacterium]
MRWWIGAWIMALAATVSAAEPVRIIFDTDMGNDVDDALALGMLHSLHSRGQCQLLAVTLTKDHKLAGPFCDAVNAFYGRGDIPIGVVKNGKTPGDSKFLPLAEAKDDGQLRYPHKLLDGKDAPDATVLLRKVLASQPDGSVVIAQVGFSTNLARLLATPGDDISPLSGKELAAKKVKLLSVMAGAFQPIGKEQRYKEYNVVEDIPAAKALVAGWPTPIIWSGFEIGIALPYPHQSILQDYRYVKHHPLSEAYTLYSPPPHDRPTWDLTAVLYGVFPDRGYFGLSPAGTVTVEDDGFTSFKPDEAGKHRYLTLSAEQRPRVLEALVQLSSEPPHQK